MDTNTSTDIMHRLYPCFEENILNINRNRLNLLCYLPTDESFLYVLAQHKRSLFS